MFYKQHRFRQIIKVINNFKIVFFIIHVFFVIVLISKRGYLKTTENKSSCQPSWVACKKNDLTEKSCPNRLGLELKRM